MGGNAPVIIKRKKVIQGGGHHGGAWKVAIFLASKLWWRVLRRVFQGCTNNRFVRRKPF